MEATPQSLTPRQSRILLLVAEGKTYQEIADQLGFHLETVRSDLRTIRDKTGRRRKPQLAAWAIKNEKSLARRVKTRAGA